MYIHEATKLALEENKFITRESWNGNWMLKPTDTAECCIAIPLFEDIKSVPRWNPNAGDLIANDWKVVD